MAQKAVETGPNMAPDGSEVVREGERAHRTHSLVREGGGGIHTL